MRMSVMTKVMSSTTVKMMLGIMNRTEEKM